MKCFQNSYIWTKNTWHLGWILEKTSKSVRICWNPTIFSWFLVWNIWENNENHNKYSRRLKHWILNEFLCDLRYFENIEKILLQQTFKQNRKPHMGVSILLGTYSVPAPNPWWLQTEMVRGLCFINTRPELTRIRGGQRGKIVKICENWLKKWWIFEKSRVFALQLLFLAKKKAPAGMRTRTKWLNISKIGENWLKSNQKK